ncbi:ubiquitin carboxyl-terminal hydrolase 8-like [Cucurbita pepo subsp. pepo]|uniref:ubiquitin carboxyl-terminal hydrolase 8-like n=1 Tax=Cucurbita pepo subsp. pepo TaxID=3664 RepID=UPI000C9D47C6|nr:ubiquitin carboxyl-terminal hydrolase 8-like [Cucurbita pepo subsp. pepo]
MGGVSEDLSTSTSHLDSDNDQRVYFVPYRWWKDAHDSVTGDAGGKRGLPFLASPGSSYAGPMKIINSIFSSDLVFNLRREEDSSQNSENGEVGISGRDYALVSGEMWVQALKWHSDSKSSTRNGGSFSAAENNIADVYPLQLRLSIQREANILGVRISKKDNVVELFRRACKIFNVESELLRIWDFSGETISFFSNSNKQRQSDQELLLELQVYGLSDFIKCKEGKKDELANSILGNSCGSSLMMNGASGNGSASCFRVNSSVFSGSSREAGSLGLTGLQNLGNTCFMNSALQCLVHTPKLVDYFLGDYGREINHDNPLGMNGEIALAFGDMLRKLWAPGASPVAPRTFKSKLARFAPQFSGFNQHDSQELLAFLLDGLHEDLNRVKKKPYVEVKDGDGRPDNEVADEYWQNHLARNDSIIVDVCQGQYKSTLVCPICKKVSTTFDPFMYLSLPLPSTTTRTMTLTVVSTDGSTPAPHTITVPKSGKWEDLIKALSISCSLKADETLLVAEVYNNSILRYLEEPADSLSLIRDGDRLVAYRLAKDDEQMPLAVFMHQSIEEQYINGKRTTRLKAFGFPLVAKLPSAFNGSDIQAIYKKLLSPFQVPAPDALEENHTSDVDAIEKTREVENGTNSGSACAIDPLRSEDADNSPSDADLQFYTTDEKGFVRGSEIQVGEFVVGSEKSKRLYVLVSWPEKQIERYDTRLLTSLPEVFKSSYLTKRPQESVSLYKCLEAFLQEEPLGPEDMWYCPTCKKHCQASKKLDLWRLPEILVIHLKRFSYSRFMKNKLETYVDFPVDDLDLSMHVAYKNGHSCTRYVLYAVSNHYGSMGGGHYTAFVHQGGEQWYDFDDSHVYPIGLDKIKSSAAYVLFYRRVVA